MHAEHRKLLSHPAISVYSQKNFETMLKCRHKLEQQVDILRNKWCEMSEGEVKECSVEAFNILQTDTTVWQQLSCKSLLESWAFVDYK